MAWFPWPELTAAAVEQRYEGLGDRSWRYTAGTFSALLDVDDEGLVRRSVAESGGPVWTAD